MSKLQQLTLLQEKISKLEKGNALLAEVVKTNPSEMNKVFMRTLKEQLMILRRELALRRLKYKD